MCVEVLTCDEPYIEQSQLLCKKVLFSQSLRPLKKAFADLKKVIRSTKFCRSDLDFFESPGLHHWPQKLKFWENIKTALRYYPLKHVYHKWMSYDVCLPQMTIICMVSEKWNMTGVMSCHFGLFFAFYTLPLEILSF